MEEKKKTFHVEAYNGSDECAFMCTSDKTIALCVVAALMTVTGVTSVIFDEVIDCECN